MTGRIPRSVAIFRQHLVKIAAALAAWPLLLSCAIGEPDHAGAPAHVADLRMAAALVPYPAHLTALSGQFTVSDATPLLFDTKDADSARVAATFADLVHRARGLRLVSKPGGSRAIVIRRLSDPNATGKEGYRLEVTPAGVTISASQTAGLFYGTITLWQLADPNAGHGA